MTSARRVTSSNETKSPLPSASSRGGSHSRISPKPSLCAILTTLLPTCPTPTTAKHLSAKKRSDSFLTENGALTGVGTLPSPCQPWKASCKRAVSTYCATLLALQPGQFVQAIPFSAKYVVSMWSKPMVAEAMNFTLEFSNSFRSQRVLVRTINASASLTVAASISAPGL